MFLFYLNSKNWYIKVTKNPDTHFEIFTDEFKANLPVKLLAAFDMLKKDGIYTKWPSITVQREGLGSHLTLSTIAKKVNISVFLSIYSNINTGYDRLLLKHEIKTSLFRCPPPGHSQFGYETNHFSGES